MSKLYNIIFIVSCILILLSFTFSMSHYLPVLQRMWIFVAVGFLLPLILNVPFYRSKIFFTYLLYIVIVAFYYQFGRNYITTSGFYFRESYIMIIPAIIFFCFEKRRNIAIGYSVLLTFFSILVYTTIVSFLIDLVFPGIIRVAFGAGREGGTIEYIAEVYYQMGLSSYEFPHALPILIPAMVAVIKEAKIKKLIRVLFIVVLFALLLLIYISGSTTALGLAAVILTLSLFVRKESFSKNAKKILFLLFILMPFILNEDIQLNFLDFIDEITGQESGLHGKIMDIEDSIKFGSDDVGTVGARKERYILTWNVFLNNIFLGGDGGGGHSALLDRLSSLGLLGFIPYIIFIITQIKYTIVFIPKNTKTYYYVGILAGFIMLTSKNMSNWYLWLCMFTILPIVLILYFNKYENNESLNRNVSVTSSRGSIHSKN